MSYKFTCRVHHLRNAAVIVFQQHTFSSFEFFWEIQHYLRTGSPESVDALVIIPDYEKIIKRCRQHPYHLILHWIYILKLIDQNVFKSRTPHFQYFRILTKKLPALKHHVIKIYLSGNTHYLRIVIINLFKIFFVHKPAWALISFRFDTVVFYFRKGIQKIRHCKIIRINHRIRRQCLLYKPAFLLFRNNIRSTIAQRLFEKIKVNPMKCPKGNTRYLIIHK